MTSEQIHRAYDLMPTPTIQAGPDASAEAIGTTHMLGKLLGFMMISEEEREKIREAVKAEAILEALTYEQ